MRLFKRAWERWIAFSHIAGRFNARVFLTLVYVLLVAPIGFVYRLVADPMRIKRRPTAFQSTTAYRENSLEAARRQS